MTPFETTVPNPRYVWGYDLGEIAYWFELGAVSLGFGTRTRHNVQEFKILRMLSSLLPTTLTTVLHWGNIGKLSSFESLKPK